MNILEEAVRAYTDQKHTKTHKFFYPLAIKEHNSKAQPECRYRVSTQ